MVGSDCRCRFKDACGSVGTGSNDAVESGRRMQAGGGEGGSGWSIGSISDVGGTVASGSAAEAIMTLPFISSSVFPYSSCQNLTSLLFGNRTPISQLTPRSLSKAGSYSGLRNFSRSPSELRKSHIDCVRCHGGGCSPCGARRSRSELYKNVPNWHE